jgi:Fe-S-cluster-containing dehydrogenase component
VDKDQCIGCKMCLQACPLGAIAFDTDLGIVFKCDLCDGDPECARMCPTGAIQFIREDAIVSQKQQVVGERLEDVIQLLRGA